MPRILLLCFVLTLWGADLDDELLTASRKGDLPLAKSLIEKGASIEAKSSYGQTPLYLAAMGGHEPLVQFLLDKGASPDVMDTFYKASMLAFVIQRKHYSIAKLLIAKSTSSSDAVLPPIASTGLPDLVQAVLDKSKPSQATLDKVYESALSRKQAEVAALLKKAGAQEPAPPVQIDTKVLDSYAGNYKSEQIPLEIKVWVKEGKLTMQVAGQPEFVPKPKSATLFEFAAVGAVIEFQSDSSFTLKQGGMSFAFKKVSQ